MKLNFTRKTWYFFLLASAAVSMLNGFFVLAWQTFGLLEQIAFCLAAIAALFLAAEKGSPAKAAQRALPASTRKPKSTSKSPVPSPARTSISGSTTRPNNTLEACVRSVSMPITACATAGLAEVASR